MSVIRASLIGAWALAALLASPVQVWADNYLSQIFVLATNFCPNGSLPTDGRLLPISQNTALFALVGTLYGGNGQTNFALPKISMPSAPQSGGGTQMLTVCIAVTGIFPSRP